MAERAETVSTSVNPVPLLPPRPMPPRPADLLPPRNGAPTSPGTEEAAGSAPLRTEARHLLVGRGVSLSGEITTCERLTVEGNVEANLHECRDIEIENGGNIAGQIALYSGEDTMAEQRRVRRAASGD